MFVLKISVFGFGC